MSALDNDKAKQLCRMIENNIIKDGYFIFDVDDWDGLHINYKSYVYGKNYEYADYTEINLSLDRYNVSDKLQVKYSFIKSVYAGRTGDSYHVYYKRKDGERDGGTSLSMREAATFISNRFIELVEQSLIERDKKNYCEFLIRRVEHLEFLTFEGKQDQEKLLKFLGQDYYDKYNLIKNKIKDPEYKDIYKMMKLDLGEVKDYIDELSKKQSNADLRCDAKKGSELIYDKNGWKVYRITTYDAAVYYGKNTKWCITGNYDGYEEYGRSYFNDYIEDYDLDGGYYFYIKSNNEKYCLLRTNDGTISSIWDAKDNQMTVAEVIAEVPDFPSIPGICEINNLPIIDCLFSGSGKLITQAAEKGADLNKKYKEYDEYPLTYYVVNDDISSVMTLLQLGADPNILHGEPLRMAISNKEPIMVKTLLDYGASVDNKVTYDPNELTLVLKAILFETPACLDLLLQAGADPNHFDHKMKEYPMQRALSMCDAKSRAIISLLLEAGADISTAYGGKYFNDKEVDDRLEHLGFI